MTFFEELKRRKVYRVAVGYVIAAGGVIQLASAVFPAWELPNWALRLVIVLLLGGFPIALILAWAFDVTPAGIQTTPAAAPSVSGHPYRRRNIFILGAFGLGVSVAAGLFLLPDATAHRTEKSIAVLPFQSFSDEKDSAYFADGIQDDILTSLAKIGDLKVISRTSVMAYRDKPPSLRAIGKALGVSAILEGSVRMSGKRVRLNVQLINAENDEHLWAEDYDRELTDIFAIQSDLAQKIAKELNAHLSPREKEQLTQKPTENDEAYFAFLKAHALNAALEDFEKLKQARQLYERAIELDPKFVLALANLSVLHSWILHTFDPSPGEREKARQYAERALEVEPNSPDAHLARGYYLYYGQRDFDAALRELALARKGLPNNAEVYLMMGAIQRRQGKWKESTANLEKAVSLNPNDPWPLQNLYFNYQMQRNFVAANRVIDRALALNPQGFSLWGLKSHLAYQLQGDLSVGEKNLELLDQSIATGRMPAPDAETKEGIALARGSILLVRGEYQKALGVVAPPAAQPSVRAGATIELLILEGIARQKLGQRAEAGAAWERAKRLAEKKVEEAPNEAKRHAQLAYVLARLGEKERAIAEGKRAVELLPISEDAFEGPGMQEMLAMVYAVTGEHGQALALIEDLLNRPGDLTVPLLKMDPAWESLRGDRAFQQLIARHEAGAN